MTLLIKGGYIVKKDQLTEKEAWSMVKDLRVCPEVHGGPQKNASRDSDYFPVFRESEGRYRIPRFYGYQRFGSPRANKMPNGLQVQLEFKGSLKPDIGQDVACARTIEALETVGGGILSLPTGYGKTTCSLFIACKMSVKTLIVVHKEFLLNQWVERVRQFIPGAHIGYIRQNKIDIVGKDVVIAMLQSVAMKDYPNDTFSTFGLTIIDETHHVCSRIFSRALFKIGSKYMLGLSATPERKDGLTRVLHWFLGPIAYMVKRECQGSVQVEQVKYVCEEFKKPPPTSVIGQISAPAVVSVLVGIEERNCMIADRVAECLHAGRKVIILSDRRNHCECLLRLVEERNIVGKSCGLYMGGMKQSQLAANEACDALFATYSLAHEGLDIPSLNTLVLATPKTDVVQSCGRILRETGEKRFDPLIIDIVDQFANLIAQSRKRSAFYKKTGFSITSVTLTNNTATEDHVPTPMALPSCAFIDDSV